MSDIKKLFNSENIKNKLFKLVNNCADTAKEKLIKTSIKKKEDGSLVTEADKKIDETIRKELVSIIPSVPIISEESEYDLKYFLEDIYWLVDPIDGTSNYVKGEDSYTINIALIHEGTPVLGIISNPPSNTIWYGCYDKAEMHTKSIIKQIETKTLNNRICKIIMSKTFDTDTNNFIKKIKNANIEYCSSSIKFCKISQGKANIYPRLTSISKWDIAAGEAILRASGGIVLDYTGEEFNYSTSSIKTGKFFALSSKSLWKEIVLNAINDK